jgi:hypothetical protein
VSSTGICLSDLLTIQVEYLRWYIGRYACGPTAAEVAKRGNSANYILGEESRRDGIYAALNEGQVVWESGQVVDLVDCVKVALLEGRSISRQLVGTQPHRSRSWEQQGKKNELGDHLQHVINGCPVFGVFSLGVAKLDFRGAETVAVIIDIGRRVPGLGTCVGLNR